MKHTMLAAMIAIASCASANHASELYAKEHDDSRDDCGCSVCITHAAMIDLARELDTAHELSLKGDELLWQQHYAEAIEVYSEVIQLTMAAFHGGLNDAWLRSGERLEKFDGFSDPVIYLPDPAIYFKRGMAYYCMGNEAASIADLAEAARKGVPEAQAALFARGISWN